MRIITHKSRGHLISKNVLSDKEDWERWELASIYLCNFYRFVPDISFSLRRVATWYLNLTHICSSVWLCWGFGVSMNVHHVELCLFLQEINHCFNTSIRRPVLNTFKKELCNQKMKSTLFSLDEATVYIYLFLSLPKTKNFLWLWNCAIYHKIFHTDHLSVSISKARGPFYNLPWNPLS